MPSIGKTGQSAFPRLTPNRTCWGHAKIDENDPERTSGLEIGFSQILAGHSFANEQPAKAKKPRKVAAGQEMLLPISGKANDQTSSQEGQQGSSGTKPKMGITNWGRSDRSSTRSMFRFTVAKRSPCSLASRGKVFFRGTASMTALPKGYDRGRPDQICP